MKCVTSGQTWTFIPRGQVFSGKSYTPRNVHVRARRRGHNVHNSRKEDEEEEEERGGICTPAVATPIAVSAASRTASLAPLLQRRPLLSHFTRFPKNRGGRRRGAACRTDEGRGGYIAMLLLQPLHFSGSDRHQTRNCAKSNSRYRTRQTLNYHPKCWLELDGFGVAQGRGLYKGRGGDHVSERGTDII